MCFQTSNQKKKKTTYPLIVHDIKTLYTKDIDFAVVLFSKFGGRNIQIYIVLFAEQTQKSQGDGDKRNTTSKKRKETLRTTKSYICIACPGKTIACAFVLIMFYFYDLILHSSMVYSIGK